MRQVQYGVQILTDIQIFNIGDSRSFLDQKLQTHPKVQNCPIADTTM